MEDWDIQDLNPQQGSGYTLPFIPFVTLPSTPNTATLRNGVAPLQTLLSQNYLPPPTPGQLLETTHHGVLGTICPHQEASWPASAPGPQIGQITEACSSEFRDELREFTEDQIHAYSSRPDWRNTDRGISLQPTGLHPLGEADLPFASGGDVQIRKPNLFFHSSHSRSSRVPPQKLEYAPGNHPTSLFQHSLEFTGTRLAPKTKRARAKGPNHVKKVPKEWPCRHETSMMCHASVRSVITNGRARTRYGSISQPVTRTVLPRKNSENLRVCKALRTRSGFSRSVEAQRSLGGDWLDRSPLFTPSPPPLRLTLRSHQRNH
ncbi:hypothetical protein BC827DRAFT_160216 [Russula dissimulans]|nr:hypothetical protein BC827DRAFT_160216 [Russula dissimulans]